MNTLAVASLFLVLGGGLLVAATTSRRLADRRLITNRLTSLHAAEPAAAVIVGASLDRALSQDAVKRVFTFGMRQTWGVRRAGSTLLIFAGLASLAALALQLAIAVPPAAAALIALAIGYGLCRFAVQTEQRRAEVDFTEHFPGALDTVVRVLRAGLPIASAIRAVAEETPGSVARIFAELADQLDIGVAMSDALTYATDRVRLSDFRFFTVSVALQHGTGGNLASTLETLTDIIRRRRGVRKKVRALTAEVRMTSYILGAVPLLVLGILSLISPSYLSPLFHDPRGKLILAVGGFNLLAGFFSMRVLMRRAAID